MSQPRNLWMGLLPLALLWLWVAWSQTPAFEREVADRSGAAIAGAASAIDGVAVTARGRDIRIGGLGLEADAAEKARAAAEAAAGVRLAKADLKPVPAIKPYVFIVERAGKRVSLSGYAPSRQARAELVSAARSAAGKDGLVVDELKFGAGAPAAFATIAGHGVKQLANLPNGRFALSGTNYSLSGTAADSAAYSAVAAAMQDLPKGARAGKIAVLPPEASGYRFSVARDGGKIILSGVVPDLKTRDALIAAAKQAVGNSGSVESKLQFASGSPPGFAAVAKSGIGLAAALGQGRFSYIGGNASLSGQAPDSAAYAKVLQALAGLPVTGTKRADGVIAPSVKVYSFEASRSGNTITLSGNVPDAETRSAVVQVAKSSSAGIVVKDGLAFASGAPKNFAALANHGVGLVGQLKAGVYRLKDGIATLEGEAPSAPVYVSVVEAMKQLPAGGKVASVKVVPPPARPYLFMAHNLGSKFSLQGYVGSPALRDRLRAAVRATGKTVEDKLEFRSGAIGEFEAAAISGIKLAAGLKGGSFKLQDNTITFSGEAENKEQYIRALTLLANFPRSVRPGAVNVIPPVAKPYTWSVERKDGVVVIAGYVPDEAMRAEIERQAKLLFPGAKISNTLQIARGTPAGDFAGAVKLALQQAAKLSSGRVSITDGELRLSGNSGDAAKAEQLRALRRMQLPRGFKLGQVEVMAPLPKKVRVDLPPVAQVVVPPRLVEEAKRRAEAEARAKAQAAAQAREAARLKAEAEARARAAADQKAKAAAEAAAKAAAEEKARAAEKAKAEAAAAKSRATKSQAGSNQSANKTGSNTSGGKCAALVAAQKPIQVHFVSGKRALLNEAKPVLNAALKHAVELARRCPDVKLLLKGHADFKGTRRDNLVLSTGRTFTIKRALIRAGFKRENIVTESYGEDRPVADNEDFFGRVKNRRVEIIFQ